MIRHCLLIAAIAVLCAAGCGGGDPATTPNDRDVTADAADPTAEPGAATASSAEQSEGERGGSAMEPVAEGASEERAPDPYTVEYVNPVTAEQAAEGWISLFDGRSLMGWQLTDDPANWRVREGVIVADDGPVDLLCTSVPFADFELEVEYRMEAEGNSGVFLRTVPEPEDVMADCYEVNIADSHPDGYTTGSLVGRQATEQPVPGSGDWKTLRMTAAGNEFRIAVEGEEVLTYRDESDSARASGLIGLQKNQGRIEFRKILLRPLGMTELFNGEDLTGWRVVPGLKSEFTVEEGTIHVVNGLGFLETEGTWADFVFQGQAKTNAPELNSGYFFRALPIEEGGNCNGYECQISNAIEGDDRRKPKDAGTGAIFRRANARYVVPNDGEWFTTTLIASGPRMCVWVDGYQVVDWEDQRAAHENPRQGRRLEAGHIALQGHDPTTDLNFRGLRIADLGGE